MAYERVQKSFGQSLSLKKHTPIVPPLIEQQTPADSQLSPKVKPSGIPSSEEREVIKRKIFDSIRRSGENQALYSHELTHVVQQNGKAVVQRVIANQQTVWKKKQSTSRFPINKINLLIL